MNIINPIILLCFTALCAAAVYGALRSSPAVPSDKGLKKRLPETLYTLLPFILLALALLVRVYRFGTVPGGVNQDGAMAAVDAKALADYGTDRFGMRFPVHLTAWGYGQMSALLSYLIAPLTKLLGLNVISMRLPLLIASMAGLLFLYLFSRDVFGKGAALAILLFAAINPWHFMQSRWALDCNLYPHFFICGLYLLNRGLNKPLCIYLSMAVFGLCMYCYGVSIYTMPVFLLAAGLYLLCKKRLTPKQLLLSALVWLLVAWPFIAVMAINSFKLPSIETPLFTIPYFSGSVRSNDILFFSESFFAQLWQNIKSLFELVVMQKKDLPWNDISGFGTMYLFSLPFFLVGISSAVKTAKDRSGAALTLLFLLTGVLAGLATNGANVNRINTIFYPIIIYTGLGIYLVMRRLKTVGLAIPAVYLAVFALFCNVYFTSYAGQIREYFLEDFGQAVASIKDEDAERFYITADSQGEGYSAVSEILTLFYHETDAEYFQGKTAEDGLYYNQKYVYSSMKNLVIDPAEDAVYVVTAADLGLFSPDKFSFLQFGRYYVVRSRGL